MVGFTLLSRSYYYLRRRSPRPPFPPDHRQAGERGAIQKSTTAPTQKKGVRARAAPQRDVFGQARSFKTKSKKVPAAAVCTVLSVLPC
jgi:hypothetical protein